MNNHVNANLCMKRICLFVFIVLAGFVFQPAVKGNYQLAGVIKYGGCPMSDITPEEPIFYCSKIGSGTPVTLTTSYNNATGQYQINGLPGEALALSITYHIVGLMWTLPGNYFISEYFNPADLTEYERLHYDIDIWFIMHMTEPWDNNSIEFSIDGPKPVHNHVLAFKWDEVLYADYYDVTISELRDVTHPDGWGFERTVIYDVTTNNSYLVDLEKSRPCTQYGASIRAFDAGDNMLAMFWITYTNGYGWNYFFKVDDCPAGDLNNDCIVNFKDFAILAQNWLEKAIRYEDLTRDDIAAMEGQMSTDPISGSDGEEFNPGTYFIYKTNLGRFGKFTVENLEKVQNNCLTILWHTYNNDGSLYSLGNALIIRGTFSCDLDEGQEIISGPTRDWYWSMINQTTRYLSPLNGAKFKLVYREK